jgi:inorganic pyrophosphatase
MDQPSRYLSYLGKKVEVVIDRPIGSRHPSLGFVYEVNYGYLPHTRAGDGYEIDAYVLGVDAPVPLFTGRCIAVVLRWDDIEHKLVVANFPLSTDQIASQIAFVERYYETEIILGDTEHRHE